jgi:hypothetical protein
MAKKVDVMRQRASVKRDLRESAMASGSIWTTMLESRGKQGATHGDTKMRERKSALFTQLGKILTFEMEETGGTNSPAQNYLSKTAFWNQVCGGGNFDHHRIL